jgi:Cu+-exporting ATPase
MSPARSELLIEGAGCASCIAKIEGALRGVPGVDSASMNFPERTVLVTGSSPEAALLDAVAAAGYTARPLRANSFAAQLEERDAAEDARYRRLLRSVMAALGLGVPILVYGLAGGSMQVSGPGSRAAWLVIGVVTLLVMRYAGGHFYRGAWQSLLHRGATMDTLIALGTGAAWVYSMLVVLLPDLLPEQARHVYFEACAMIIALVNLGLALEQRARGRASAALRELAGQQARSARVIRDGEERDLPIERVVPGDRLRLRPGEKVPVDGEVLEGSSRIDESMLSGEAMPVHKAPGDSVAAGTVNRDSALVLRATRVGSETVLAQIIETVRAAQASRPPIGRLADRVAAWFVPIVVVIALLSGALWLLLGPDPSLGHALVATVTVLIIACPCALGLATPMSLMVGVGRAARAGILIRSGAALQRAAELTTVVLDKTGTVTRGEPQLTALEGFQGFPPNELLLMAAALEQHSQHPIGAAILAAAASKQLQIPQLSDVEEAAGQGMRGQLDGVEIVLGNGSFLQQAGVSVEPLQAQADARADEGKTVVFLARAGRLAGMLAISDPVKEGAARAVARFRDMGLRVLILSGDNELTTAAVARQVGVEEYRAGLLPVDKSDGLQALQAQGEVVAMVGDGINDAPALALADVGFAIGSGTDIAMESAGITLIGGELSSVADAILLSRATLRNIRQNLWGAFAYNVAAIPLAAGALYPFTGLLLSPVVAAAAMALSSVTVVSNASRLRWIRLESHGQAGAGARSP